MQMIIVLFLRKIHEATHTHVLTIRRRVHHDKVMSACYYLHHHTNGSSYIRPLLPNGEIARTAEVAELTSGGGCRRNALNVSATPNRALNPSST